MYSGVTNKLIFRDRMRLYLNGLVVLNSGKGCGCGQLFSRIPLSKIDSIRTIDDVDPGKVT